MVTYLFIQYLVVFILTKMGVEILNNIGLLLKMLTKKQGALITEYMEYVIKLQSN